MSLLHARTLGVTLLLFVLSPAGKAQKPSVVQLVPPPTWRLVTSGPLSVATVARFGGDPAVEREYGVKKLELRHYQQGARHAEVLIEEASDPTSAYGLLTFYRTKDSIALKGLDMAFVGPSNAIMARGQTFIRVYPSEGSKLSQEDFRSILVVLGGARLSRDEAEAYPAPLPSAGLVPGTEKYLLGMEAARRILPNFRTDLLGFSQGAEVRVGVYNVQSNDSTVLIVSYPTPQMARVRFGAMSDLLEINQDKAPGGVFGKRSGSFVFLVLSHNSGVAEELLKRFRTSSSVSWNEPAPQPERFALDLARLILSIVVLVLGIAAAAVIGGVLVALSRRVARRFFPNSGWANPDREKVIRLHLDDLS